MLSAKSAYIANEICVLDVQRLKLWFVSNESVKDMYLAWFHVFECWSVLLLGASFASLTLRDYHERLLP